MTNNQTPADRIQELIASNDRLYKRKNVLLKEVYKAQEFYTTILFLGEHSEGKKEFRRLVLQAASKLKEELDNVLEEDK